MWTEEVVKVKMMTEYLKCGALDVNKDMNRLFKQNYNFRQYEKDMDWVRETKKPAPRRLTIVEKRQEQAEKLASFDPKGG